MFSMYIQKKITTTKFTPKIRNHVPPTCSSQMHIDSPAFSAYFCNYMFFEHFLFIQQQEQTELVLLGHFT